MTPTILPLSEPYGPAAYVTAGRGAPLVLLHGVGMQSAAWHPQISALSKCYRVIALDLPGHGGSARLSKDASLSDFVAWAEAALDALGLSCVNLAGHSMGALIAGGLSVTAPERVSRVALLNGVFRRSASAREAVLARAAAIEEGDFDLETPLARWFSSSRSDQSARCDVASWLSAVDHAGYATAYAAFARGDATYADGLSRIACPLLALTGAEDPNSTPAMARAMAEAAPRGQAVILEGARHMANLTAPEAVNAALKTWLAQPTSITAPKPETIR